MKKIILMAGFLLAVAYSSAAEVSVKTVKYSDLTSLVRNNQGQVILVDFWRHDCVPCKKEFPHLVQMHQKFAGQGFMLVTVHLNMAVDKDLVGGVEKTTLPFLQKMKADFVNLILDEPETVWMSKLDGGSVPTLFLFNKQNRIAQKFDDVEDHEKLEKQIQELLSKP